MTITLPSGRDVDLPDLDAIDREIEQADAAIEFAQADRRHLVKLRRKLKPEPIKPAPKPAKE